MSRRGVLIASAFIVFAGVAWTGYLLFSGNDEDDRHYARGETELQISNVAGYPVSLFRAGRQVLDAMSINDNPTASLWLSAGNYFLSARTDDGHELLFPVSLTGYRSGPDVDGAFTVTVRPAPAESPPQLRQDLPAYRFIPSGTFLLGDRLNPQEPHHVWQTAYFISPFEVTNSQYHAFLSTPDGYPDDANWTEEGRKWKVAGTSHASAQLTPTKADYVRFGLPDQPVTYVTWFEANAFCHWLTRRIGNGRWQYSLPTDAEWEKAARGPDNLDYGLGSTVSDADVDLYNWRKNPATREPVIGINASLTQFRPNRYGLYHMTGNVLEWSQSKYRPYSRAVPFADDDRNHDDGTDRRSARGGSWYSASNAYLQIPYRDAFQPEHNSHELGFRIVVHRLP